MIEPWYSFSMDASTRPHQITDAYMSYLYASGAYPYMKEIRQEVHQDSGFGQEAYELVFKTEGFSSVIWLLRNKTTVLRVIRSKEPAAFYALIISDTQEHLDHAVSELTGVMVKPEPTADNQIKVGFWRQGINGMPIMSSHAIDAPSWNEIKTNYPEASHDSLDKLVSTDPDKISGRIAMLYGPAGTGKTTLLRALSREWKSWCDISYIIDPESFLNNPNYLVNVLLNEPDEQEWDTITSSYLKPGEDRWQLVVLEDAGELIIKDGREGAGQALSRLLNMSDGILGQGRKILFAITTNHDVKELHRSVTRPGRCLVTAEIGEFSAEEARQWIGHAVTGPMTLAELYARRGDSAPIMIEQDHDTAQEVGMYL
jgi:hypothetical protein